MNVIKTVASVTVNMLLRNDDDLYQNNNKVSKLKKK